MLIKGANLNQRQRQQVLAAYVNRHTVEHPNPVIGAAVKPTDAEYINGHAFYFVKDGSRLSEKHKWCEPHYMAD